ncbi:penicillin-binding protein [Romboutsia maritimum]|uniref:Penicillin-binding protein 1A n=1 Tax=Romboutsia maritimum TaxID=2020948 RepID=A0A371IQ77_9FIRM|nr:transglycosylase domain-containing protein [Romboutsia maritimum]RDY22622.1 penicillin-binding protein [Romboutsia maritimum]
MTNDNNKNGNKIRRRQVSPSTNKTSSTTRPNPNRSSNVNRSNTSNRPNSSNKPSSSSRSSSTSTKKISNSNKKKQDKFKFLRVAGTVFLVLLVVGAAAGTGLAFASLRDVSPVTKALLDEKTYQTTKIYYSNGNLLSNAPSINKKEPVKLDKINSNLKNAVISIEDERFYEHKGVDLVGLARSVVKTLMGTKQGGSTIPMQVSKMLLTSTEQSIPRKIKDIYYAYEMSKNLSKDEILESYLNNFFVGKGLIGAEAGARGYFDKSASELKLEEAALLAGSTKNPSSYSAYVTSKLDGTESKSDLESKLLFFANTNDDNFDDPTDADFILVDKLESWGLVHDKDTYKQLKAGTMVVRKAVNNPKAKKRQEVVLKKMLELGYITQEEHDKAVAAPINIKLPKSSEKVATSVEDLIEYDVIDALMAQGNTKDEAYNMFYSGGLKINTTIDPNMQDTLEKQYDDNRNFPGHTVGPDGISQPQSSMVILDYRTGQIKALVGGRHVTGRKTLNRATYPQQPGSTIKPLSVYTPAIDTLKITQANSASDAKGGYKFSKNNKWNPNTTTAGYGSMSLRKALAYSSNTIAVKTAEMLGGSYEECVDIMIDYLKNFGISTVVDNKTEKEDKTDRRFPSLTLGGMTKGVSPLEMAAAYGTLANGGVYVEPTIFTTITSYDKQLIVKTTPEEHKVIDPEVAYVITDMLHSVITEGIGGSAAIGNEMPVAGKTGTTNEGLDVWFVGYTPYYVGATYIGDDAGRKDPSTGTTISRRTVAGGSTTAARLWSKVMTDVHKNLTVTKFKVPSNIYFNKINLIDGGFSSGGSSAAFIKGTAPTKASSHSSVQQHPKKEESNTEEAPASQKPEEKPSTPPDNGGNTTQPDNNNTSGNGANAIPTPTPPPTDTGTTTPPDTGGSATTPPAQQPAQ